MAFKVSPADFAAAAPPEARADAPAGRGRGPQWEAYDRLGRQAVRLAKTSPPPPLPLPPLPGPPAPTDRPRTRVEVEAAWDAIEAAIEGSRR
ncbi:hypothetical protein [Patulibacter defluvii]|uniref:hypothetical protein n=1 Tax=Patulibacter defluvii TaxID=3095358 RepID=UPI002A764967|nr:hypothetical protein [Patulibacter sp. DM4]